MSISKVSYKRYIVEDNSDTKLVAQDWVRCACDIMLIVEAVK